VSRIFAAALLLTTAPAAAQRASENAVTAAEDAFGSSIGREAIGLYGAGSVRGFSAIAAGNARIESLYFDQVWNPSGRLRRSSTIRVGLSAQGFPFPAPTGIVDYALRKPGETAAGALYVSADSYDNRSIEADVELPLAGERLGIGGGIGLYRNGFTNGSDSLQHVEGLTLRWRPSPAVEVQPFWGRSDIYGDEAGPIYIPAGAVLPPQPPRRRFNGPDWARYRGIALFYGSIARISPAPGWTLRTGLFRTAFDDERAFSNLLVDVRPDGSARQLLIADPPSKLASTSGELRLTRSVTDGERLHVVHLSGRGRLRDNRYDGSDSIDLGATVIGRRVDTPKPAFRFGPQSRDRVRQGTGGVAYEMRWRGVGEMAAGVQRSAYRKRVAQPGVAVAETETGVWLYNASVALNVTDALVAYAGITRGLEESGVAPANAANRGEALAAIRTSQRDGGIRWSLTPDLRLTAGLFDVRKPYFSLDQNNRFTLLGDVRHRGLETSLTGKLAPNLSIVAGAVLLDADVGGEGVRLGRVGPRPVGVPARNFQLNADWRPKLLPGLSLDAAIRHQGRMSARRDNAVDLPARTTFDAGLRYATKIFDRPSSLRVEVTNVTDRKGFDLRGSGAYDIAEGRVIGLSLATDF
jgi:iron complex outermembrane receptor protein